VVAAVLGTESAERVESAAERAELPHADASGITPASTTITIHDFGRLRTNVHYVSRAASSGQRVSRARTVPVTWLSLEDGTSPAAIEVRVV
jgi:hypothetical protein